MKVKSKLMSNHLIIIQGLITILIFFCLRFTGSFNSIELINYNILSRLLPLEERDDRIILIPICEKVNRRKLTRAIKNISRFNPIAIGVNITNQPGLEEGKRLPIPESLKKNNIYFSRDISSNNVPELFDNIPREQIVLSEFPIDPDEYIRRYVLSEFTNREGELELYLSMAVRLSEDYLSFYDDQFEVVSTRPKSLDMTLNYSNGSVDIPRLDHLSGGYTLNSNSNSFLNSNQTFIRYRNHFEEEQMCLSENQIFPFKKKGSGGKYISIDTGFKILSLDNILKGDIIVDDFKDKIVIIGFANPFIDGVDDFHQPAEISTSSKEEILTSIEIEAHATSQLISAVRDGRVLSRFVPEYIENSIFLLFGVLGIYLGISSKSIFRGFIFFIIPLLLLFLLSSFLFIYYGIWFPIISISLLFLSNTLGIGLTNYIVQSQKARNDLSEMIVLQQKKEIEDRKEQVKNAAEIARKKTEVINQTFARVHAGPLQDLAITLKNLRNEVLNTNETAEQLNTINTSLRNIFRDLENEGLEESHSFRLGSGEILNLHHPLHSLLTETFVSTTNRLSDMPPMKFRSLDSLERNEKVHEQFGFKEKYVICQALEEALTNVAKHAKGATFVSATHEIVDNEYILIVEDDGCGLPATYTLGDGSRQIQISVSQIGGQIFLQPSSTDTQCKGTVWQLKFTFNAKPI